MERSTSILLAIHWHHLYWCRHYFNSKCAIDFDHFMVAGCQWCFIAGRFNLYDTDCKQQRGNGQLCQQPASKYIWLDNDPGADRSYTHAFCFVIFLKCKFKLKKAQQFVVLFFNVI